jgi:hypothetical protein
LCCAGDRRDPASVGAQSVTLTESDALSRLSAESPRARAIRAGIDIARVDVLSAERWPNPRVTWDREAVAGVAENILMVAQPLPVTGRRGLEIQAASALVNATTSRAHDEIRRLRADLRLAFADLSAVQTRERELTTARDRLRALAEVLAKREEAGDAAGFDRLRAEREVLEVETDRVVAATERARAQATLASFFTDVRDPSALIAAGRITEVEATLGASYDEGAPLFKIARTDALELKAFVPAAETSAVRSLTGVALEIPGRAEPLPLQFHHVHDPGVLDAATRALPVQMEVKNPDGQLLIGQSGTAILHTGGRQRVPAVPRSAMLMEAGRPYVFVQLGGERFARRFVERGARERLIPILITAMAAGLALIPLALGGGKAGSEIQTPMAIVILCGLTSSTLLNMIVVPTLYLQYRRPSTVPTGRTH